MMDRSFKAIAEFDSIRVSPIDGRTHDDANRSGRVGDPIVRRHDVFLGNDSRAG
jgi:hypothetical protein